METANRPNRTDPATPDSLAAALRDLVREAVRVELTDQRTNPAPPRLLSVQEAAAALGISRARFYRELSAERIRTVHIGGRRLVPEAALRDYIDAIASPAAA